MKHWLQIDVSNLAGIPGATRKVSSSGPIEGLRTALGWVEASEPVRVDLTLRVVHDGIEVWGTVAGLMHLNCSRCLVDFEQGFELEVDEIFYRESDQAERREAYEVSDQVVDLEPMLRDVIVLSIPITPVHAPDCRGLCPECGADLNIEHCKHGEEKVDPRWAPLQNLMARRSGGDDEEVER